MSFQDWEPVVFKKVNKTSISKQNPAGTKEFNKLNEDDVPKLTKISLEQSKALREARTAKGLSQSDFAKSLSIDAAIIKDYENGTIKNFNQKTYNTLMRKLGVKV